MQGLVIGHQDYGPGGVSEDGGYVLNNLSDAGVYPLTSAIQLSDLGPAGISTRYDGSEISSTTGHQIRFGGMNQDSAEMGTWFDSDV